MNDCKLVISDLRIWLHLGCGEEEKYHPQLVHFDIELIFHAPPKGMASDQLVDTVCYVDIVSEIQALCKSKPFNLIEHLVQCVHEDICNTLGDKKEAIALINITVNKIGAPVPGVHGGVHFNYSAPPIKNRTKK